MSDEENAGWSLTESDPSVFTALLSGLGVKGLQVEDLWSLDPEALSELTDIKAFIFLFKYVGGIEESSKAGKSDPAFPGYFAHQVINNACATLAILNAVFNFPQSHPSAAGESDQKTKMELGSELENLKDFGVGMDSATLGWTISNSDKIRATHNSFARSDPFSLDPSFNQSREKEDAYHFVSYLPVAGQLYELDGLQEHPRSHGPVPETGAAGGEQSWLGRAREVIQERIASYPAGALHFSLLAITADPMPSLQSQLATAQEKNQEMLTAQLLSKISDEEEKRKRWAFENSLRQHNFISFAHQLLLALAKAGKLAPAIEASTAKNKERREKDAEKRAKGEFVGMEED